jgi:hypothetical protein
MLKKFRTNHIKIILLILLAIIVPSFLFWGVSSYINRENKEQPIISIQGKNLDSEKIKEAINTARVFYHLNSSTNQQQEINEKMIHAKAFEYILLLWKAKKENIQVDDRQVVKIIKNMLAPSGEFDKQLYKKYLRRYLRMSAREFEEYIRNILLAEKVVDKYVREKINITETELKNAYKNMNERIKLSYLFIPYSNEAIKGEISEKELKAYYHDHKTEFTKKNAVKLKYLAVDKNNQQIIDKINEIYEKYNDIDTLAAELSIRPAISAWLDGKTEIDGINAETTKIFNLASALPKNTLSPLIKLENKYFIFEPVEQKEEIILPFQQVKNQIEETITEERKKDKAKNKAEKILNSLKNKDNYSLEKIAKKYNVSYQETKLISEAVFDYTLNWGKGIYQKLKALRKDTLYEKLITQPEGIYIVKLEDYQPIEEQEYVKEKDNYRQRLLREKTFLEKINFIYQLQRQSNFNFRSPEKTNN